MDGWKYINTSTVTTEDTATITTWLATKLGQILTTLNLNSNVS